MPKTPVWLPRNEVLRFEEIHLVVSLFAEMGLNKIRPSGGEPLMRHEVETLVLMLAGVARIESISMTTNGFLFAKKAAAFKQSGLHGVTVSLHSLKPERFNQITGGGVFSKVLAGIKAAKEAGFGSLKINAIIIRGCNDDEIVDLASLVRVSHSIQIATGSDFQPRQNRSMPIR
jgi:cyclic pyranopterin phosphate synthase